MDVSQKSTTERLADLWYSHRPSLNLNRREIVNSRTGDTVAVLDAGAGQRLMRRTGEKGVSDYTKALHAFLEARQKYSDLVRGGSSLEVETKADREMSQAEDALERALDERLDERIRKMVLVREDYREDFV